MKTEEIVTVLESNFGDQITGKNLKNLDPWIELTPDALLAICEFLRNDESLSFDYLACISAVDYFIADPKKAARADFEPHIEMVYHLESYTHGHRLVLKAILPRWKNDQEGELPEISSVSSIWETANWHEREVFDLSGIHFSDHPNLRRILCPEDWVGYPLRKDYQMPTEYHGIRGE